MSRKSTITSRRQQNQEAISSPISPESATYVVDVSTLFERYADTVYKVTLAQMRNKVDAEDVFQDVFVSLVRYAKKLTSDEHAKAWLIRVTINACKKRLTKESKRRTEPLEENGAAYIDNDNHELWDAVGKLDEKYRAVIHLYYYEGYSVHEIAELLEEKETTVKTRMMRARSKLRAMLGGDLDV